MPNKIIIKKKILNFNKKFLFLVIKVSVLDGFLFHLLLMESKAKNLLMSEDVLASIKAIKKLV